MKTNREGIVTEVAMKNTYRYRRKAVGKFLISVMYTQEIAFGSKKVKEIGEVLEERVSN